MKKILFIAAIAALSLASCAGNADKTNAADQNATEVAADETGATDPTPDAVAPQWTARDFGKVVDLDDDNILRPDTKVAQLTIIDFNATWCVPCKQLTPVFDASAKKFDGVQFISVDIDKNPLTAQAFAVESVPTVVFLKPDGSATRYIGTGDLLPAEKFEKLVNDNF